MNRRTAVRPGDTFAVPLGENRYGAVRVLRISEEDATALVAVTPWLDTRVPALDDPVLRQILRNNRGFFQGEPALCWYAGEPPAELLYLGSILPSEEELAIDPQGRYGGVWGPNVARDVVLESGLGEEIPARGANRPTTESAEPIPEDEFWSLIAMLDWEADSDQEIVDPLVVALAKLDPGKIEGFHERLGRLLARLTGEEFVREAHVLVGASEPYFSSDHFLDVRCAAVAKGRDFYRQVLAAPELLPVGQEFECLLHVAEDAYRRRTGAVAEFSMIG